MEDIIHLLRQHNVRVVFFTPPYYEAYTRYYIEQDPNSISEFRTNIKRLQNEYGIEYYDYSIDERFAQDYRLFKDSDHLNHCGKQLFTQILMENVQK